MDKVWGWMVVVVVMVVLATICSSVEVTAAADVAADVIVSMANKSKARKRGAFTGHALRVFNDAN